jgi:hypothetical protein
MGALELEGRDTVPTPKRGALLWRLMWVLAESRRMYPYVSGRVLLQKGHDGDKADVFWAIEPHRLAFVVVRMALYILRKDADASDLGDDELARAELVAAFPPLGPLTAKKVITPRDLHAHVLAQLRAGFKWAKADAKKRGVEPSAAAAVRARLPVLLREAAPPPVRGARGGGGVALPLTTAQEEDVMDAAAFRDGSDDEL